MFLIPLTARKRSNAGNHPPALNCGSDKFTMRGTLIRVGCMPLLGAANIGIIVIFRTNRPCVVDEARPILLRFSIIL